MEAAWADHATVDLSLLKDIRQAKSKVRKIIFRKVNFQVFRKFINRTQWDVFPGIRVQSRSGRSLRKLSLGHNSPPSTGIGSQERKARDQHG